MQLGEFPGEDHLPISATGDREVSERSFETMWGFVEQHCSSFGGEFPEPFATTRALPGQEPLEHEPAGWQTTTDKGRDRRRWAGHYLDAEPARTHRSHESLAGV